MLSELHPRHLHPIALVPPLPSEGHISRLCFHLALKVDRLMDCCSNLKELCLDAGRGKGDNKTDTCRFTQTLKRVQETNQKTTIVTCEFSARQE